MSHRWSLEELALTHKWIPHKCFMHWSGCPLLAWCGTCFKIKDGSRALRTTESMGDLSRQLHLLLLVSHFLIRWSQLNPGFPSRAELLCAWLMVHPVRILAPLMHFISPYLTEALPEFLMSFYPRPLPPPCSWRTVLFKISSRRRHCWIRFWAFRMLFLPRCEDSMDGGQFDSVSIHVLRVLNMQEMIAFCPCLLPHNSHHIFVFAQDWKGVIALNVLFFYQLEKYLTVSCLNVAFHTVPAFVGGGAWVISFCVSYCPEERKTEPQCLECQWLSKFLADLPLVPIPKFGPRKDSCMWIISGRGSESWGKPGLRSWWWCGVPALPRILNVLLHACLVLKC